MKAKIIELKFNKKFRDYILYVDERVEYLGDLDEITATLLNKGADQKELVRVFKFMASNKHTKAIFAMDNGKVKYLSSK